MLKTLEPSRLPTARSRLPNRTAATAASSSGIEVTKLSSTIPAKPALRPMTSAMSTVAPTR